MTCGASLSAGISISCASALEVLERSVGLALDASGVCSSPSVHCLTLLTSAVLDAFLSMSIESIAAWPAFTFDGRVLVIPATLLAVLLTAFVFMFRRRRAFPRAVGPDVPPEDLESIYRQYKHSEVTRRTSMSQVIEAAARSSTGGGPSGLPCIVVLGQPEQRHVIRPGQQRIGRHSDNDIILLDETVHRHHAMLVASDQSFELRDLGGANGTRVNGRECQSVLLQHGDVIAFGNLQVRFDASGDPN